MSIALDVLTQHTLKVCQSAEVMLQAMYLLTDGLPDEVIRAREPQLHKALLSLVETQPAIRAISIVGRDGLLLLSSLVSPITHIDSSDRDYFQIAKTGRTGAYVTPVLIPKVPGPAFFSISRRRVGLDGRFNGVFTVALLPTDFEKFYAELNPDRAELFELLRTQGEDLARFPIPIDPHYVRDATQAPLTKQLVLHPQSGQYRAVSSLDGVERILAYRTIPEYELVVLVGIQTAQLREAWLTNMGSHLVFGVPATLLLLMVLIVAIRRTRLLYDEAEGRRAAEAALSRTQRMEAIGQLTSGVSHDFNNLLMIISGSAELIGRRVTDAALLRSVESIEGAVQRGTTLTRQLLSFASRQALAVQDIDLTQHLLALDDIIRRTVRSDIELRMDVPTTPCMVRVDPGELDLAILNIAANARDAMPNGGSLVMRVRAVKLDGSPAVADLSGEFVALSITDTGAGVPPEALPRVFEPFFTTKGTGKGSGLGLSQVYGLARQSGGTATLVSEPGRTVVTIYLPAIGNTVMPRAVTTPALTASSGSQMGQKRSVGRRVLVVDDNADVGDIVRDLLSEIGCRVASASSGHEALGRLSSGESYDLVLSDMIMPGLSGIDLARILRRLHPALPVIMTSGYSAVAQEALEEGFVFLQKPYEMQRLRELVETTFARSGTEPNSAPGYEPKESLGS